jgi:two-component system, sensor histidine kinase FlrB
MMAAKPELIENRRTELTAAFAAFGSMSEQLTDAFDALRAQVAQLRGELSAAHAGRDHLAARLQALLGGLPGGVLVLSASGEVQECNPAALSLLGEPLLGQRFNDVLKRAVLGVPGAGEHTELKGGRFVAV